MRNTTAPGNTLLTRGLGALSRRLPGGWTLRRIVKQPQGPAYRSDALLTISAPDGKKSVLVVEAKQRVNPAQAAAMSPMLEAAAREAKATGKLLVTRYLSPLARERLVADGISYLDLTGNIRISLDRPALFIESRGADRDPEPQQRTSRSLKGGSAARIVRALCDWAPPVGVRELARRANVNPGYATRILTLLEQEDVVSRDPSGSVVAVKWRDLLRRWAQDYTVTRTNRAVACLAPRGIDSLLVRLAKYQRRWAVTGSAAIPPAASTAATRLLSCYVESVEQAVEELDLRPADSGANVMLLEPFNSVIWERLQDRSNLRAVAVSQCAVDLLTGTGREPSEGEALLSWMEKHQRAWRA